MKTKVEFFADTNIGNLEQAINDFLASGILVHSIQQSQSSYVMPADMHNHEALSEAVTIVTVSVYYMDEKPPDGIPV